LVARIGKLRGGGLQGGFVPVGEDDGGARFREGGGRRQADPRRGARDERNLAREVVCRIHL
jgi:hypothetical protein